jgi:hypothetical protein
MSTAVIPIPSPNPAPNFDPTNTESIYGQIGGQIGNKPVLDDLNLVNLQSTGLGIRRRATQQQGRGLEILGHAVEYLVDSRMFVIDQPSTRADAEAVQLLMLLSRQVFAECAQVPQPARRLRHWIADRLNTPAAC